MKVSVASTSSTCVLSATWIAVDVPVNIFGMLMLSVPPGSGCLWQRFANARPGRASSMNWFISQLGGTPYPPVPSTRSRSRIRRGADVLGVLGQPLSALTRIVPAELMPNQIPNPG